MILDAFNEFDAVGTALTATRASTNVIDLRGFADSAIGCPLYVYVQVNTALTSGGSSTLTVAIQTDDNSSFSSATTLFTTGSIAKASLVAGYRILSVALPEGCERYIRLNYTVGTADFTAGTITAELIPYRAQYDKYYPSAIPVT